MTDDFERQLHDRLDARANTVTVTDDMADVFERSSRKNRRTVRALSFALVVVMCGAAVGVIVAARGNEAPATAKAKSGRATLQATNAKVPIVPAAGGPTFAGSGSSSAASYAIAGNGVSATRLFFSPGNAQPMAKVFTRTNASGVTVRAYRANTPNNMSGPPWWTPPGWCFPNGYVLADVSDADIAAQANGSLYASQHDGSQLGGTVNVVGQAEQHVRWVAIAQAPADAARVRASFPDGSHDEMAPVDGVAVLVGTGASEPKEVSATLEAFDASGGSLGKAKIVGSGLTWLQIQSDTVSPPPTVPNGGTGILKVAPADQSKCSPPQTLPAPGKTQPADPAAAKQAVTDVFNAAFAKGISDQVFEKYFDDSHGFADVMKKLRAGSFKQQVDTARMKLNDVVFLDATTAAIQYEIDIPGYATPSFAPRFTEAHLVNGEWKLARSGWCNDVSMAGVQCPA
jgi:hypothetical protein